MKHLRLLLSLAALVASSAVLTAVPAAPTNLATVVSGSTIFITWLAPPGPVLGFYLAAGLTPGGTVAANLLAPNPSGPLNGFTAFPIPAGTYYFRVHAIDATGTGPASNEVVTVVGGGGPGPGPCVGPPAAPTVHAVVLGFIVNVGLTPGGGCPATNYALHAGSGPSLSNITIVNLGTVTGLSTAAPAGVYFVRVFAQNAAGTSAPSNEIIVRVPGGDALFRQ